MSGKAARHRFAGSFHSRCRSLHSRGRRRDAVISGRALQANAETPGKTVWFVRHGQAEHNVLYESGEATASKALLDPVLTALGEKQAESLKCDPSLKPLLSLPPEEGGLELVVSSPLRRTVQTALRAVEGWTSARPGRRVVLNADLQESGEVPCDTGSPLDDLQAYFKQDADVLELGELWPGWDVKEGDFEDTGQVLRARLQRFTDWLFSREESRIMVIGHHNVLVALLGVTFLNCEVRQFQFGQAGVWVPTFPRISDDDSELSDKETAHLKVYDPMIRRKFKTWGFDAPQRLR